MFLNGKSRFACNRYTDYENIIHAGFIHYLTLFRIVLNNRKTKIKKTNILAEHYELINLHDFLKFLKF
jgi:hypothetical protein